uniref:TMC domain-containing protein n=1 Tax=Dracunculus medinensis TaxID=318479 RepID=A0A0N4U8W3_DRAME
LTFPNFFDLISKIERYHPRFALRLQLARVLFLYIVNYYTLIVSLMFMLDTMESQRSAGQQLLLADQYMDNHFNFPKLNSSISFALFNRTKREFLPTTIANMTQEPTPVTTLNMADTKTWTTVFPNFGPFAIANPKAIISEGSKISISTSRFLAHPIGKADWSKNTTDEPTPLNYSTGFHAISAMQVTDWYDECWENLIGQEITKLVTMDLLMTIASILVIDFLRGLWVRHCNLWWFWNLECTFPEYGEFKVAENVLHLVNNQGMIWLGLFFVPMLPAINNIKLIILMYIRAWAVMTCNVPARQIFRASRSQERFYSIIIQLLDRNLSKGLVDVIKYMSSPGIVIPVLLLLLLIIYFLFALVRGLREANGDLSKQLVHERTEEKKRIFELAGGRRRRSTNANFYREFYKSVNNNNTDRTGILPVDKLF